MTERAPIVRIKMPRKCRECGNVKFTSELIVRGECGDVCADCWSAAVAAAISAELSAEVK